MHEVETMAYRQTPWHGLGEQIPSGASCDDILRLARLEWELSMEPIFTFDRSGGPDITPTAHQIPNRLAVMRKHDKYVYEIMSANYQPVQPREMIDVFREFADAGNLTLETAGSLRHGAIVWVLAKLDKQFTLPGGDRNEAYILLSNSNDGSRSYEGQATDVCVVCMNTFRMATNGKADRLFKYRHTSGLNVEEIRKQAQRDIGLIRESHDRLAEVAGLMSEVTVTPQNAVQYVALLAAPELLELDNKAVAKLTAPELLALPAPDINKIGAQARGMLSDIEYAPGQTIAARKGTVWGMFNGITHYVDHVAGKNVEGRLGSAWFGPGQELKTRAFTLANLYVDALTK